MSPRRLPSVVLPLAIAVAVGALLLLSADAPPPEAVRLIFQGALGSLGGISSTLMAWVPLVLASAGLVVTFAAGLWNIGVEGQIVMGAVSATAVARLVPAPSGVVLPLMLLAGAAGGLLWGLLVGVLRVKGRVNEIFGGLGLDFVATGLVVYLVIGPWKRAGSASTSGTDLFPREAWLPSTPSWVVSWVVVWAVLAAAFLVALGVWRVWRHRQVRGVESPVRGPFLGRVSTPWLVVGTVALSGVVSGVGRVFGFPSEARLRTTGSLTASWVALALAVAAVLLVYFLMRGTNFGLRLRAVGANPRSAFLWGISTNRHLLGAFAICGALAGLGGALHASGFHHKLVPAVSGGYGFLGILVVLLAGFGARGIAPIALFFAVISVGSTQLQLRLQLDSALGGVLQGVLVLFTLLAGGWQLRRAHRSRHGSEEGG